MPETTPTVDPVDEKKTHRKLELEDKILRYFQNKEIEKERKAENQLLFEEIEQWFEECDSDEDIVLRDNLHQLQAASQERILRLQSPLP